MGVTILKVALSQFQKVTKYQTDACDNVFLCNSKYGGVDMVSMCVVQVKLSQKSSRKFITTYTLLDGSSQATIVTEDVLKNPLGETLHYSQDTNCRNNKKFNSHHRIRVVKCCQF